MFLSLRRSTKKWTMSIRNGGIILNHFLVIFKNKISYEKSNPVIFLLKYFLAKRRISFLFYFQKF